VSAPKLVQVVDATTQLRTVERITALVEKAKEILGDEACLDVLDGAEGQNLSELQARLIDASSYKNDTHSHRRPAVTWRTFDENELVDPAFWMPSGTPQMLATAFQRMCWFCNNEPSYVASPITGCEIGPLCLLKIVGSALRVRVDG